MKKISIILGMLFTMLLSTSMVMAVDAGNVIDINPPDNGWTDTSPVTVFAQINTSATNVTVEFYDEDNQLVCTRDNVNTNDWVNCTYPNYTEGGGQWYWYVKITKTGYDDYYSNGGVLDDSYIVGLMGCNAFWSRHPIECQSRATGAVQANCYGEGTYFNNYAGYCLYYDANITLESHTTGERWYTNDEPTSDYWEWQDNDLAERYSFDDTFVGEWIHINRTEHRVCYLMNWLENRTGYFSLSLLKDTPNLIAYPTLNPSETDDLDVDVYWCSNDIENDQPENMCHGAEQHYVATTTYTLENGVQDFSGCYGFLNGGIVPDARYNNQTWLQYGGCYFEGCDIDIPSTGLDYLENVGEVVMKDSTLNCLDAGGCNNVDFGFSQQGETYTFSDIRGRLELDNVTIDPENDDLLLVKLYGWDLQIKDTQCGNFHDWTFSEYGTNTSCWETKYLSGDAHGRLISFFMGAEEEWDIDNLVPSVLNITNTDCTGLNLQADMQNSTSKLGGDYYIHDSNLYSINAHYDPNYWDISNVRTWEARFDSEMTGHTSTWIYPYCNGDIHNYRYYIQHGIMTLPSSCDMQGTWVIYSSATLDANGNTLGCNDAIVFGRDDMADNWMCCDYAVIVYDDGATFKNAVMDNSPLKPVLLYADNANVYNVNITANNAFYTPEAYPDWHTWDIWESILWGAPFNYSMLDVSGNNCTVYNTRLYDTYTDGGVGNNLSITIVGCTGNIGSICDYEAPPEEQGYQARYTSQDLTLITGDVIGTAGASFVPLVGVVIAVLITIGLATGGLVTIARTFRRR